MNKALDYLKLCKRKCKNCPRTPIVKRCLQEIRSMKKEVLTGRDRISLPTSYTKPFGKKKFRKCMLKYDLENPTLICQNIRNMLGVPTSVCDNFKKAKENSQTHENYWHEYLKYKHSDIIPQYCYKDCRLDFISKTDKTIYECKLSIIYYNDNQHEKYKKRFPNYKIKYLFGSNCMYRVLDNKKIFYIDESVTRYFGDHPPLNKYDIMSSCLYDSDSTIKDKKFKISKKNEDNLHALQQKYRQCGNCFKYNIKTNAKFNYKYCFDCYKYRSMKTKQCPTCKNKISKFQFEKYKICYNCARKKYNF